MKLGRFSAAHQPIYLVHNRRVSALVSVPASQQEFTTPGTYSWTAPAGVTSVSVVAIGPGATNAGGGGGLTWANGLSVTPVQSYTVVVGAGGYTGDGSTYFSSFNGTACVARGGTSGGGGVYGGTNKGAGGAVRIIWGNGRAFPSTGTSN